MNRRMFLKRIAAVAAGAVTVPVMLANKNAEDPMLLALRRAWKNTKFKKPLNGYCWYWIATVIVSNPTPDPGEDFIFRNMSLYPEYEIGEIIILSNGHVYKYTKAVG